MHANKAKLDSSASFFLISLSASLSSLLHASPALPSPANRGGKKGVERKVWWEREAARKVSKEEEEEAFGNFPHFSSGYPRYTYVVSAKK